MRRILFTIIYLLISVLIFAQNYSTDLMVTISGKKVEGFIFKVDSSDVEMLIEHNDKQMVINTHPVRISKIRFRQETYNIEKMTPKEIQNIQAQERKLITEELLANETSFDQSFIYTSTNNFIFPAKFNENTKTRTISHLNLWDFKMDKFEVLKWNKYSHFIVDGKELDYEYVRFLNIDGTLYANTDPGKKNYYANRVSEGKYNIYKYVIVTQNSTGGTPSKWDRYFFSKGYEDVEMVKYKNLPNEILESPDSKPYIQAYKNIKKKHRIMHFTGLGLIAGGITAIAVQASKSSDPPIVPIVVAFSGSLTSILGGMLYINKENENLRKAISAYQ